MKSVIDRGTLYGRLPYHTVNHGAAVLRSFKYGVIATTARTLRPFTITTMLCPLVGNLASNDDAYLPTYLA